MQKWQHKLLSEKQQQSIERRIQLFEQATGAELQICILNHADPYPAASLRFALVFSVLFSSCLALAFPHLTGWQYLALEATVLVLGLALGKISLFKVLFLSPYETAREVSEKTFELFHRLGVHETTHRAGSLLVLAMQEKKIEILIDKKLKEKMTQEQLQGVLAPVQLFFGKKDYEMGFHYAISILESHYIRAFNGTIPAVAKQKQGGELSNSLIWINR